MKLRPSQEDIIDGVFENDEQLVVAGMGAGKTSATLHALLELWLDGVIASGVVLAPPLVAATVWPREAAKWASLDGRVVVRFAGTPAQRKKALKWAAEEQDEELRIVAMSLYVCKWLKDNRQLIPGDCGLAVDETSFFKSPRSKNGHALRALTGRFVVRYGLTGTPRPNGWEDAWGQYQMLTDGRLWEPFDDWRRFNFMPKDYNGYNWEVHEFRAKQLERDVAPLTTHVDADLDLPDLSTGPDFDFEIELPENARKLYNEMEEDLVIRVAKTLKHRSKLQMLERTNPEDDLVAALSEAVASAKLAQIAQGYIYDKVEQEDGNLKGEAVAELHDRKAKALEEIVEMAGGENLLIWYGYRHDIELIERVLGAKKSLPRLGGGVSASQGRKHIEAFGRGELPLLLAHPASAAHGIDELKNGSRRMVWFCPTWSAEQYEQALKRLHRPGQTRPVFSHQIVARGTVDEIKLNRVAYKLQDQAEWSRLIARVKEEMNRL